MTISEIYKFALEHGIEDMDVKIVIYNGEDQVSWAVVDNINYINEILLEGEIEDNTFQGL